MPLTPQQQQNIKNIIASAEMEYGSLDEQTKKQIELIVAGKLDVEIAIANAITEAHKHVRQ